MAAIYASQTLRTELIRAPGTVSTSATTTASVDTAVLGGASTLQLLIASPPATATNASARWSVLRLESSNDLSTWSTVPGCDGTTNATATSTQFVLPTWNNTAVGQTVRFEVPYCGVYGRYFRLVFQPPNTNYHTVAAIALIGRTAFSPDTDAERGASVTVFAR